MAAIAYPVWSTLKTNIGSILTSVAVDEKAEDPRREFRVTVDRWRPWIESQQNIAMVNVLIDAVQTAGPGSGGGSRRYMQQRITINLDMYALGSAEQQAGELTPADVVAAKRLDLLCAQVGHGITRMISRDLGFDPGLIDTGDYQLSLLLYSQEREETTGQYAPARWQLEVTAPYFPAEGAITDLTVLEIDLEQFGVRFEYPESVTFNGEPVTFNGEVVKYGGN